MTTHAERLSRCEFFEGLSDASRRALADYAVEEHHQKRDILFAESTRGDHMHVLVEGHVQLVKSAPDGAEVVIRTVNPGEAFAEVILFEQDRYPVTAQAVTAATTLSIRRSDMLALLDDPGFRQDFIALLMRRMRYLANRVRYLTMYDVEDRFVRFLEEQFGHETDITLTLSRKDIASAIGTTPETLSRLLHRLRTERELDWDGKRLKLHKDFWVARREA